MTFVEGMMFDTSDPVPREEGRHKIHKSTTFKNIGMGLGGVGIGYAGLKIGKAAPKVASAAEAWEKSAPASIGKKILNKAKRMFRLDSKAQLIRFAAGDYARKYLPDEPILTRKGQPGYNPLVEGQIKAALLRKQPRSEKKQKAYGRELSRQTVVLKPGYAPKQVVAGGEEGKKRFMPLLKIERPYRKIRSQMRQMIKGSRTPPKEPEPMPGEMLPKERGKVPVRGHDYEGGKISELYDYGEANKPTKIVYIAPARLHPHKKTPLTQKEVSVKAQAQRDPIAWHQARVKAGMSPNLIEKRYKHKKNLPDVFLPHTVATESSREAQAVRDTLAGKLRKLRTDIIQPLRAERRKKLGLPPNKPMTEGEKRTIWSKSEKMGYAPLRGEIEKPKMRTMVSIGGAKLHPTVLSRAHQKLESEIAGSTARHTDKAKAIHEHIQGRVREAFGRIDLERHHPGIAESIKRSGEQNVNSAFNANRTLPLEKEEVNRLSEFLGAPHDWIKQQHKQFVHHNYWATGAGEKRIKQILQTQLFKRVSGVPEQTTKVGSSLLKRIGKAFRFDTRHKDIQFQAPGSKSMWNLAQKLKGFSLTKVGKKEAILGGALAGGITAADAATSAVYPDPDKTRAKSAGAGAKRGAIYGGVLAATELPIRRALMKGGPRLTNWHSNGKEIRFKNKDDDFRPRDIAIGGIEGAAGFYTTDRLVKAINPRTTGAKLATAGLIGGAATGTIGYGLNRFLREFKRRQKQKKQLDMASKGMEIRFQRWNPPSTEGATSPYNPKKRLTVAQDRYRKMVRANEINRKESNLAKSAIAGAALGALVSGKRLSRKAGAGIGAGVATAAESVLIHRANRTRDPFGEEPISQKRIQRIPYQAAGLGVAGVLGHKLLKHYKFNAQTKEIRFQQVIPIEPDPEPYFQRQTSRWLRHPVGRVKEAEKWTRRIKRIHQDIKSTKDAQGNIIDERGRVRTPEWKKDWFKRSLVTGTAIAGLGAAALAGRRIGRNMRVIGRAMEKGLPESALTETERAQLYLKSGNIGRAIKSSFPKPAGIFGKLKDVGGQVRSNLRQMREGVLGKTNRWVEGKVGGIEHAELKRAHIGTPEESVTGIKVTNPAYTSEHLQRIHAEEEKAQARVSSLQRQRQRAEKRAGKSQQTIEDIIRKPRGLSSKLKLVQFQSEPKYEHYPVQVKPHFRRARRGQRPHEKPKNREAALIGTAAAGIPASAILGTWWHKTRPARLARAQSREEYLVARRLEKYAGKAFRLSAKLDDILQFKSMSKIYVVRHGCTKLNGSEQCPDKIRGHIDVPLDEKGREQAVKTGKRLAGKKIDHIYTSDLSRAHETAEIISEHLDGVPITPTEGLRPWKLGSEIEGQETSKVIGKIHRLVDTPDRAPKDGEPLSEFKDRFMGTIQAIKEKHPDGNVAVVTHLRGMQLLKSIDDEGYFRPNKFKSKDGHPKPGGIEVINNEPANPV